ncbi:MAG: phenylalanine--tRNA ligase subunit alpha [bacterium]
MELNLAAAEKRLLAALPKDGSAMSPAQLVAAGFSSETEVMQAAGAPQRHGLVDVKEERETLHSLSKEGLKFQTAGLPERRAAEALHAAGGQLSLAELGPKAGLDAGEVNVAAGWLRKKGWATMEKGPAGVTVRLVGGRPAQGMDEVVLLDLGATPKATREPGAIAMLAQRGGLLVETVRVQRSLALTKAGQAFAKGLKPDDVAGIEVNQVTPELIAKWAALTPAERARQHLRPFDFNVAVTVPTPGKAHPLTHILTEIRSIFWSMGFSEIAGDYVESAFWNMDALFIPQDHPARDMQDTFYLAEPASVAVAKADLDRGEAVHTKGGGTGSTGWGGAFDRSVSQKAMLRTHTTNTTIRYLAEHFHNVKAPKDVHRVFGLGRVFRKETMDATHLPEFTQIEGIVVEPGVTFNTLVGLCRHFFKEIGFPQVRFRPAYFPYTEPSMEIEVFYNGRWMELGGCGVFRPEVTQPLGVPGNVLAWGFGLERLAMMRLGLKDIRDLYISDVKWLRETPVR